MSDSPQQPSTMDADKMLDVYIRDYLVKRRFAASLRAFDAEVKIPANVRAIEAPRGFLFEWWTVFWDTFISRYKRHQGPVEPCNEALPQQQQHQGVQHQHQGFNMNNAIIGRSPWIASAPVRQPSSKHGDNVGTVINPLTSTNHMASDRFTSTNHMATVQGMNNSMTSSLITPSAQGPYGLSRGANAIGVLTDMPLKGWPLMGLDQIQTRLQQQQGQLSYQHPIEGQLHPPTERKRKQPLSPMCVANNSGTTKAIAIQPSSATVPMPSSQHNDKINIDDFLNYGALDGNDTSIVSHADDTKPDVDTSNGFTFLEIGSFQATSVDCCHISGDGKLVAVGGQDKKVRLWCTSSLETKGTFDEHLQAITDICFSASKKWLATCSVDKSVRIWDAQNMGCSVRTFNGHINPVRSIDFHPKDDLLCSSDDIEIRFWAIKSRGCVKALKGGASRVRFQSGLGKYLASAFEKSVALADHENPQSRKLVLEGHESNVQSICWDHSGERLVSLSEDLVRVWKIDSELNANCIHELSVPEKRFRCGVFHPGYPSLLIIGCHQSMELWNMVENKMMMPVEEPVYSVAVSCESGLIASAGHIDNAVKLWK